MDVWGPNLFADVTVIQTDSREAANSLVARRQLISREAGREGGEYISINFHFVFVRILKYISTNIHFVFVRILKYICI